jgi:hypothetical protein
LISTPPRFVSPRCLNFNSYDLCDWNEKAAIVLLSPRRVSGALDEQSGTLRKAKDIMRRRVLKARDSAGNERLRVNFYLLRD